MNRDSHNPQELKLSGLLGLSKHTKGSQALVVRSAEGRQRTDERVAALLQ